MATKEVYTDLDGKGVSRLKNFIIESETIVDAIVKTFIAGEAINGGKALYIKPDGMVYSLLPSNLDNADKYVGISETSSNEGDTCRVVIAGKNTTLGQGWVAGQEYFIGDTGFLTTTPPSPPAIVKKVAVGISDDTILLKDFLEFELI